MNFTIDQLKELFDDNSALFNLDQDIYDISEPGTPIFRIKSSSQESTKMAKKTIEELSSSNLQLTQQVAYLQQNLNAQICINENMSKTLQRLQLQLADQITKNQQLTKDYIKKHEECFELKREIMKKPNKVKKVVTCPSERSTGSPGFPESKPYKKLTLCKSMIDCIQNNHKF